MKELLKNARVSQGKKLKEVSAQTGIDQALLSKFESGNRLPTKTQVAALASALEIPQEDILVAWLKEKILSEFLNSKGRL